MMAKTSKTGQKAAVYERAPDDWYVDEPFCTELLLEHERFDGRNWDPACGRGTIPLAMHGAGLHCLASDLRARGYGFQHNFLTDKPLEDIDNIICNPPYGKGLLAVEFIERALTIARNKVAVLVNEKFLYSERRHSLLWSGRNHYRHYFLCSRPSMPPGHMLEAGEIEAEGGSKNFCWIIFLRGFAGHPTGHGLIKVKK